jgi:hypothetical protein
MAKRKRATDPRPKAIVIKAKDLSQKVETRGNSARLAKIKEKPYDKAPTYTTELPIKRITHGKGLTLTKKRLTVGGKIKLTRTVTGGPSNRGKKKV